MSSEVEMICRDCGTPFVLDARQLAWLRKRVEAQGGEFHLPRRCDECLTRTACDRNAALVRAVCRACGAVFARPAILLDPAACRACHDEERR